METGLEVWNLPDWSSKPKKSVNGMEFEGFGLQVLSQGCSSAFRQVAENGQRCIYEKIPA
ncbi:MAG: hypothetical protein R6V77_07565 [Candidatus Cloacimonadaceae bacterium]